MSSSTPQPHGGAYCSIDLQLRISSGILSQSNRGNVWQNYQEPVGYSNDQSHPPPEPEQFVPPQDAYNPVAYHEDSEQNTITAAPRPDKVTRGSRDVKHRDSKNKHEKSQKSSQKSSQQDGRHHSQNGHGNNEHSIKHRSHRSHRVRLSSGRKRDGEVVITKEEKIKITERKTRTVIFPGKHHHK